MFFPNSRMLWGLCTMYCRFWCVLGELGPFWERTRFWEPVPGDRFCGFGEPVPRTGSAVPGFDGFQQVLRFPGSVSGNRFRETGFLPTRGIAKVPGSEGCVPEVSKVSLFDGLGPVPEVWVPERVLGTWFREPDVFKKRSQGYFVL